MKSNRTSKRQSNVASGYPPLDVKEFARLCTAEASVAIKNHQQSVRTPVMVSAKQLRDSYTRERMTSLIEGLGEDRLTALCKRSPIQLRWFLQELNLPDAHEDFFPASGDPFGKIVDWHTLFLGRFSIRSAPYVTGGSGIDILVRDLSLEDGFSDDKLYSFEPSDANIAIVRRAFSALHGHDLSETFDGVIEALRKRSGLSIVGKVTASVKIKMTRLIAACGPEIQVADGVVSVRSPRSVSFTPASKIPGFKAPRLRTPEEERAYRSPHQDADNPWPTLCCPARTEVVASI